MNVDLVIANSLGVLSNSEFLIHSPSRWSESVNCNSKHFSYYPFSLGYLSSILKTKTSLIVKMLDGCLNRMSKEDYYRKILFFNPKFLFIESSSMSYKDNLEIALRLKKEINTTILFAGPHVSIFSSEAIKDGIDYVFKGEYEASVYDFFLFNKFNLSERIFLSSDTLKFSEFPWPEDDDISRFSYAMPGEPSSKYKEIQMQAGRGCYGNCSFCVAKNIYYKDKNPISRNPFDVINEMEYLKKKYIDLEGFFFDEEDHFLSTDFINSFLEIINTRRLNYKIEAMGRIYNLNHSIIKKLKKAGYYKLRLGIESLDSGIQLNHGKVISIQKLDEVLHSCKNEGIDVYLTFQVGLPGSSKDKDLKTLDLIKERLRMKMIENLQVSIFTPLPGTKAYEFAISHATFKTDDLIEYNGGKNAVISWNDYSYKEINKVYEEYLEERDHILFVNKIFSRNFLYWLYDVIRKNSFVSVIFKIKKRLLREYQYLFGAFL